MKVNAVGNRDQCGRCGTHHGGNNHSCRIHGAVSQGCCETQCQPQDYVWIDGGVFEHPDAPDNGKINISPRGIVEINKIPNGYIEDGEKNRITHSLVRFIPGPDAILLAVLDRKWILGQLPEYGSHSPSRTAELKKNTKQRHVEIYAAAVSALEAAGGVEKIDNLDQVERLATLRSLYRQVVEATSCHYDTAKRNVTKAMHRERYQIVQQREELAHWQQRAHAAEAKLKSPWGGTREGAGRPRITEEKMYDEVKISAEDGKAHCPVCGAEGEYQEDGQTCEESVWVWEGDRLVAVPSREDESEPEPR